MGKRTQRRRSAGSGDRSFFLCLGMLAVFFLAGAVLGQVLARRTPELVDAELVQYLTDYCTLDTDETSTGLVFLSALLIYFRYPFAAFLLSFAAPGAVLLPLVSAVFGFFLSFSVCCFAGTFGNMGILLAVAVFGLRCIVSLPCFFLLAVPALQRSSLALAGIFTGKGKRVLKPRQGAEQWLGLAILAAILLAGALAEVFIPPALLQKVVINYF